MARLLVKFRPEPPRATNDHAASFEIPYEPQHQPPSRKRSEHIRKKRERHGGKQLRRHDQIGGMRVIEFPSSDYDAAFDDYASDPAVEYVEHDSVVEAHSFTDPLSSLQWHLTKLRVEQARSIATASPNVVVAVLDSGIVANHPDLTNVVMLAGSDFVANPDDDLPVDDYVGAYSVKHGTACAGIIGATVNNSVGVAGIAGGVTIMPVRVLEGSRGLLSDCVSGLLFAADNGAHIVSMSIGMGNTQAVFDALRYATQKGLMTVASSGNAGVNGTFMPAGFSHLTVGSSDPYDNPMKKETHTYGHCYGATLDVIAPGHYVASTSGLKSETDSVVRYGSAASDWVTDVGGAGYFTPDTATYDPMARGLFNGTSAACPVVAGVAALVLSKNPTLPPRHVASIIRATAVDVVGASGWEQYQGWGRADALSAVSYAGAIPQALPSSAAKTTVRADTYTYVTSWDAVPNAAYYHLVIYRMVFPDNDPEADPISLPFDYYTTETSWTDSVPPYAVVAHGLGGTCQMGTDYIEVTEYLDGIAVRRPYGSSTTLERSTDGGAYEAIGTFDGYEYLDTEVVGHSTYTYRVDALESAAVSPQQVILSYILYDSCILQVPLPLGSGTDAGLATDAATALKVIKLLNSGADSGIGADSAQPLVAYALGYKLYDAAMYLIENLGSANDSGIGVDSASALTIVQVFGSAIDIGYSSDSGSIVDAPQEGNIGSGKDAGGSYDTGFTSVLITFSGSDYGYSGDVGSISSALSLIGIGFDTGISSDRGILSSYRQWIERDDRGHNWTKRDKTQAGWSKKDKNVTAWTSR